MVQGYIYLLMFSNLDDNIKEVFYKVGISKKGVLYRYSHSKDMKYRIKVIVEIPMEYTKARDLEHKVKVRYYNYLYQPKFPFAGSKTECFSILPTISFNDKHFDNEFVIDPDKKSLEVRDLELDIIKDKIKIESIDTSRISLNYINFSNTIYSPLNKIFIGKNTVDNDKEFVQCLVNLILNMCSNLKQVGYGVFTEMKYLFQRYKCKGAIKITNPDKERFFRSNILTIIPLVSPQQNLVFTPEEFVKLEILKIINRSNYALGEDISLYFIALGDIKRASKSLGIPFTELSWREFSKLKVKEDTIFQEKIGELE